MTKKDAPYLIDDTVEILVIADRSGSMSAIKDDAIGGFNSFLEEQQRIDGDAAMTLVLFDDRYEVPVESQDLQKVKPLTESTFVPRGMTAMNDAIGRAVNDLISRNPEKAIICILTDGMENASKEFTTPQIKELMKTVESKGWEVVYLAANQDAFSEGSIRGITNNINFAATSKGIRDAYATMNTTATTYRTNLNAEASN
jgi:Mg-chelatase subunit ChlD